MLEVVEQMGGCLTVEKEEWKCRIKLKPNNYYRMVKNQADRRLYILPADIRRSID